MKTLTNHTIIYDDDCPLCKAYTAGFVMAEMLDKNGRQPFTTISTELEHCIDKSRACNEIALVDRMSGEVTYGIESIFKILAVRFPKVTALFHWTPFSKSMRLLYNFISYNRKVIMPGAEFGKGCTPSMHLGYRWMYIVFAWLFSSVILSQYSILLTDFLPAGSLYREFAICAGQIGFQFITISILRKDRRIEYLGNLMTISLGGALLLVPVLIASLWFSVAGYIALLWFGGVVGLMFLEHLRRTRYLQINAWATLSWVTYRILVLIIIFYFFAI